MDGQARKRDDGVSGIRGSEKAGEKRGRGQIPCGRPESEKRVVDFTVDRSGQGSVDTWDREGDTGWEGRDFHKVGTGSRIK